MWASNRQELSSGPSMFIFKEEQDEKAHINRANYLKREIVGKAELFVFHPFAQLNKTFPSLKHSSGE